MCPPVWWFVILSNRGEREIVLAAEGSFMTVCEKLRKGKDKCGLLQRRPGRVPGFTQRGVPRKNGMVKLKVAISFKRLQVIFIHSYGSSIAPKMTF